MSENVLTVRNWHYDSSFKAYKDKPASQILFK